MHKLIIVLLLCGMILGCKTTSSYTVTNTSVPSMNTSTFVPPKEPSSIAEVNFNVKITLGEYVVANESPLNYGSAIITSKGNGLYHINVEVARLYSHHLGNIESDFNITSGKINLLEKDMTDVKVTFVENKLMIDYPESSRFGGMNAEPKGTYYLKHMDFNENAFMEILFNIAKLDTKNCIELTDVYVISDAENRQLLLLRTLDNTTHNKVVSEKVVVYFEQEKKFQYIGEILGTENKKLTDKLISLGFKQKPIYQTLRKDAYDRYININMKRYDDGEMDGIDKPLTNSEAFYVATGEEMKTGMSDNHHDKDNMGSIFITEIDHSDDKTVTIHKYEDVRIDDMDTHTATIDWLVVDRLSGEVLKWQR
jgi:hypothetical protein